MAVETNRWGIIYNPKAGSRNTQKKWDKIREYMEERGVMFDYMQSEGYGSVERLARMLANNGYRTIVVVGGDGAINDAVNGIMTSSAENKSEIALGIIPNGIGNDFAAYWGLEKDNYKEAVDWIINRGARFVGITNKTRRFCGLQWVSILVSMFLLLFERMLHRMHLKVNGEHIRDTIMTVCIGSARGYGLTPSAVPYNGWLDVSVVYRPELLQLLKGLWLLVQGRLLNLRKVVKPYRTRKVKILRAQNAAISLDGRQLYKECPLDIRIMPESLTLIIPE